MTTKKTLRLEVLGRRRQKLQVEVDEVRELIHAEVRDAKTSGLSGPKIANALGVSHQAVYLMLEKETT